MWKMKINNLLVAVCAALMLAACTTPKNITYFPDAVNGETFTYAGVKYTFTVDGTTSTLKDELGGTYAGTDGVYSLSNPTVVLPIVSDSAAVFDTDALSVITATGSYSVTGESDGKFYGTLTVGGSSGAFTYSFASVSGANSLSSIKVGKDVNLSIAANLGKVSLEAGGKSFAVDAGKDYTVVGETSAATITGLSGSIYGASDALSALTVNSYSISEKVTATGNYAVVGNGSSLTGFASLSSSVQLGADFTGGLTVNGEALKVTGDEEVTVTGDSTGKKIAAISGLDNEAVLVSVGSASQAVFDKSATDVTVGSAAYTLGLGADVTFGLSGTTVTGISGLSGTVTGNLTNLTWLGTSTDKVTISGDTLMAVSSGTSNVSATFDSVGGSVTMAGAAMANATVNTNEEGSFVLGKASATALKVEGDKEVTFALGSDTAVSAITNFDEAGTITGALSGIIFSSGTTVGDATALSTTDKDIAMVNDGEGNLAIAKLSGGFALTGAGGATKAITDSTGKFTFGSASSQIITVSGDSSVEFGLDTSAKVNSIASIASATLNASVSSSDSFNVSLNGGSAVTFGGISKAVNLMFDSDGKLSTVSGASIISGLTEDDTLTVIAGSSATVNEKAINITGDTNYNIAVNGGEIGEISGVSNKASIGAFTGVEEATIKTDSEGNIYFGSTQFSISGDSAVTFIANTSASVTAINDLAGSVKTTLNAVTIDGEEVTISGASNATLTYTADGDGVTKIEGLVSNATVEGAENAALVMAGSSGTVNASLTANGAAYELINDSNGVTITGGNVVAGLDSGASLVAGAGGNYTVNGSVLDGVTSGAVIVGNSDGTAQIYSATDVTEPTTEEQGNADSLAAAAGVEDSDYASVSTAEENAINEAISSGDTSDVNLDGDMKLTLKNSGTDAQEADFSNSTGKKNVALAEGDQDVKFNDEGGNVAKISSGKSTETKNVELGAGGDVVAVASDTKSEVNITAGEGPDTIVAAANATVDVSKGGATKVQATGKATVTMNNYDSDSKAGVQTSNNDIAAALLNGNIGLDDDGVRTNKDGAKVVINTASASADEAEETDEEETTNTGSTTVNLYNNSGKMFKVGYTYADGGSIDMSTQKAAVILQGNNIVDAKGKSNTTYKGASTLLGGSGADTIFAGSGDSVNAGSGANTVILRSADDRSRNDENGATIEAAGRTNVQNFNYGFEATSDVIAISDLNSAKIQADSSGNVVIKSGTAKTTLQGASSSDSTSDGSAEILIYNATSQENERTAVAGEGSVFVVSSDEESTVKNYIGDDSGLDFTEFEGDVNLVLNGDSLGTANFGGQDVNVKGVNAVTVGAGNSLVLGSAKKETITTGSGNATVWGGAGADMMIGFTETSSTTKDGSTSYGFFTAAGSSLLGAASSGKDTVSGFTFLTSENANFADKVLTDGTFANVTLDEGNVKLKFEKGGSDVLTITDATDKKIQLTNFAGETSVLQVGDSSLTYDGGSTRYVATGSDATLVAAEDLAQTSSFGFDVNIWLDSEYSTLVGEGKTYEGDIKTVDGRNVSGSAVLTGNSVNNSIVAAQGDTWLWGGNSNSADTLVSGEGSDIFFYGLINKNEGSDIITGASEGDTLNLGNFSVTEVSDLQFNGDNVTFAFTSGGSVTMNYTDGASITFREGSLAYNGEDWDVTLNS